MLDESVDSIDNLGCDLDVGIKMGGGGGTTNSEERRLARLLDDPEGFGMEGGRRRTIFPDLGGVGKGFAG